MKQEARIVHLLDCLQKSAPPVSFLSKYFVTFSSKCDIFLFLTVLYLYLPSQTVFDENSIYSAKEK